MHARASWLVGHRLLKDQHIVTRITLQSAPSATLAAPPTVLQSIASHLSRIELYNVLDAQIVPVLHYAAANSAFTSAHVDALQACGADLTALCISEYFYGSNEWSHAVTPRMADIAQLTGLTKLHLTLDQSSQAVDFQPLSQLLAVEDLALHCLRHQASCAGILESSQHTLCHIKLASISWSMDTYTALQQIPHLDTLVHKLRDLTADQAYLLAGVSARYIHLDLHQARLLAEHPLLALSTANPEAQILELTLWNLDDTSCQDLASMSSLKSLTIANSPGFTADTFNVHPNVTELKLINCLDANVICVLHIINRVFPALESIAFQRWGDPRLGLELLADAAQYLSVGRNLRSIDLRGVQDSTDNAVMILQVVIEVAQKQGRAQPLVTLHLPKNGTPCGLYQSLGYAMEWLRAPPFWEYLNIFGNNGRTVVCSYGRDTRQSFMKVLCNRLLKNLQLDDFVTYGAIVAIVAFGGQD